MDPQTLNFLITLIILLVVLLQFLLGAGSQNQRVQELEARLSQIESILIALQKRQGS